MTQGETRIEGIVLDERLTVSLDELTQLCHSTAQLIELMVTEGVLCPQGRQPADWRFDGLEIRRARRAMRLQRDLELNLAGAALVLDLLEEVETLRERLSTLERLIGNHRP